MADPLHLYSDLASWWPLLSPPEEYAEEAEVYRGIIDESARIAVREVLELGSGGGNNASHLKAHFSMTLVDRSPQMLDVSRRLNPECTHLEGDMRTVRLDRRFDAVFAHDAVDYLTTEAELDELAATARAHCRPGGVVLFVPDHVSETFEPGTGHGGKDGEGRGLRYLEWQWDPDPTDSTYVFDMAYLLREGEEVTVVHDRHIAGLFSTETWLSTMERNGFEARLAQVPISHGDVLHLLIGVG